MVMIAVLGCGSDKKTSTASDPNVITRTVRDIDFERCVVFDLGRLPIFRAKGDTLPEPDKYDFSPGFLPPRDSIIKIVAYLDDRTPDTAIRSARPQATMYVDPDDTLSDDPDGAYKTQAWVEVIEEFDYYYSPTRYYIWFLEPVVGLDHVLGVYMEVKRAGGEIDTIGDISAQPYRLKLIKPTQYFEVNHHVWEYEWKNVYSLVNLTNINPAALDVRIYKGTPLSPDNPNPADLSHQEGVEYIQILGLDRGDNYGSGEPDNEIDRVLCVDALMGWLIFPDRHPFDSWIGFARDQAGNFVFLNDPVPEMYQSRNPMIMSQYSTYYLVINYPQP